MAAQEQATGTVEFHVENIGGISSAKVSLPPGVSVLTGRNATNRTSFLQAITAALGSDIANLKADAEHGSVEMRMAGETYQRRLQRTGDSVEFSGDRYLDDPAVADLFAFLFATNEARQSVVQGRDLRELIMRPVDTDEINEEIERLVEEKRRVDERISEIEEKRDQLPELEARKCDLTETISEKQDALDQKERDISERNENIDESKDKRDALETKLGELRDIRAELESVRGSIEKQSQSVSSLKRERAELQNELDEIDTEPTQTSQDLQTQITNLRERRKRLSAEVSDLQNLIQYNEEQLEADAETVLRAGKATGEDQSITSQLVESDSERVVCWTCGSDVQRSQITDTVERLEDLRSQRLNELNEVKDQLSSLKSQQQERERLKDRRAELSDRLTDLKSEIERRENQISALKDRREELTGEIERLEADIETLESEDFESVLELHREANQLEFEIDSLETDREDVVQQIEDIEQSIGELQSLKQEREQLTSDLTDMRTKIDQIEKGAVESFNEHMSAILHRLEYDNIERIWIERIEQTVREGRKKVEKTQFELHIIRSTNSGAAFEDKIANLSESERDVTGLIFALAGYLVHELHEIVPFMLLDSLEAIDSERIAELVDYFSEYVDYLIIALLPEDAQALNDSYHRVDGI